MALLCFVLFIYSEVGLLEDLEDLHRRGVGRPWWAIATLLKNISEPDISTVCGFLKPKCRFFGPESCMIYSSIIFI